MTLRITEEVTHAQVSGRPVVALESALVTHGLPRPDNLQVARALHDVVR
ncbi:MAG: pseudouridine-5'-phosphate glycosidase, partial [Actinomycetota bacterium]